MAEMARNTAPILNSWKEIASYLDRGVRTVQRWERELQLPVHRIGKGNRSPVYALVSELRFWMATSDMNGAHKAPAQALPSLLSGDGHVNTATPLQISHQLMAESLKLVRTVAETSVRQQRQAKILQKRILEMRARLR